MPNSNLLKHWYYSLFLDMNYELIYRQLREMDQESDTAFVLYYCSRPPQTNRGRLYSKDAELFANASQNRKMGYDAFTGTIAASEVLQSKMIHCILPLFGMALANTYLSDCQDRKI